MTIHLINPRSDTLPWITKKRESGWSTFNPLKLGLKGMVEPWRIELQTFALRMSLFWLFLNGFRAFWCAAYTYTHPNTTMHWDKCGTRKQLFWSSNFRLKNTSLPCLSEHSHTPPKPRLRLLWVGGVSFTKYEATEPMINFLNYKKNNQLGLHAYSPMGRRSIPSPSSGGLMRNRIARVSAPKGPNLFLILCRTPTEKIEPSLRRHALG